MCAQHISVNDMRKGLIEVPQGGSPSSSGTSSEAFFSPDQSPPGLERSDRTSSGSVPEFYLNLDGTERARSPAGRDESVKPDVSEAVVRLLKKIDRSQQNVDFVLSLPDSVIVKVFSFLSLRHLFLCSHVSKHWATVANHPSLWLRQAELHLSRSFRRGSLGSLGRKEFIELANCGAIVVVGGSEEKSEEMVDGYRIEGDCWHAVDPMNEPRGSAACAVVQGSLYVCGGRARRRSCDSTEHEGSNLPNKFESLASLERYDSRTRTWTTMSPMEFPRQGHTMTAVGRKLVIFGGWTADPKTDSLKHFVSNVEMYDIDTDRWQEVVDVVVEQSFGSTISFSGSIYLLGGFSSNYHDMFGFHRFDIETRHWENLEGMPTERSFFSVSTFGRYIYVFGGMINGRSCKTNVVERFDTRKQTWKEMAPMPSARSLTAAVSVGSFIYVMGGNDDKYEIVGSIERYCVAENRWDVVAAMPRPRAFHCAGVLPLSAIRKNAKAYHARVEPMRSPHSHPVHRKSDDSAFSSRKRKKEASDGEKKKGRVRPSH